MSLADNPFLTKIAELTNATFSEVTVPAYTDFATKSNLMISSGDIPDLVHAYPAETMQLHGKSGAFLVLNDIIKGSAVISRDYTTQMQELMKADDGKIYALVPIGGRNPQFNAVRRDLIDEINGGVMPLTPDAWYEVFKKFKAKYPDSVPYSGFSGLGGMDILFRAYGVLIGANGAAWQYTNGKYINAFEAPLARDAVLYHQRLYSEGLPDKTFVTDTLQDFLDRKYNRKFIIAPNPLNSVLSYVTHYVKNSEPLSMIEPGPQPLYNDPRIDLSNVYSLLAPLGWHGLAIGARTKARDAAVRVMETLLSDNVKTLTAWGREGIEHTVVNGQKRLDVAKATETSYRNIHAFMRAYSTADHMDVLMQQQLGNVQPERRDAYAKALARGSAIAFEQAAKVPSVTPASFVKLTADMTSRQTESYEKSKSIILKAITGEITMEEYDAQVAAFVKQYQFITDEYNKKLAEAKARLGM